MTSDQFSALSDSLFSASIIIYALAAFAFCGELAFGRRASRPTSSLGQAVSPKTCGLVQPPAPALRLRSDGAGRRPG